MRLALVLLVALVLAPAAQAKTPPPDSVYPSTIGGLKYICARWGAPPKRIVVACIPRTSVKPGAA